MKWLLSRLLLCLGVFASAAFSQERSSPAVAANLWPQVIYITYVRVIDTESGNEIQDRTVIISGDRISDVRDSKGVNASAGAKVVNGRSRF